MILEIDNLFVGSSAEPYFWWSTGNQVVSLELSEAE